MRSADEHADSEESEDGESRADSEDVQLNTSGAGLPGVDTDDLAHDETPRPPRYAEGSEPDEWERGLQATYESLTANLESNQLEIPQRTLTHTEASRLVAQAYQIEQTARALHTWAHRELSNAKKNVEFSERRLRAAETQVRKIVELIEGHRYWHVVQYEPAGVPIVPYVVEQNGEICSFSMNGSDPVPVIIALDSRRVG